MAVDQLNGWYVILLRPALTRGPLLRAVRASAANPVLLPGLRLAAADDPDAANRQLARALAAPLCAVTSPAAVHFARRLPAWSQAGSSRFAAVGGGTAAALRRAGMDVALLPQVQQDSDGLLALLASGKPPQSIGLITAPGGRDRLAAGAAAMGIPLYRADVYQRLPPRLDARHRRALRAIHAPAAILHSSAEAWSNLHTALGADHWARLAAWPVIASSARLADQAMADGFRCGPVAASARPLDLLAALRAWVQSSPMPAMD